MAEERELEEFRQAQENRRTMWKQENQLLECMFHSIITAGQGAIRALLLINGGAAVACLAFLGQAYGSPDWATFAPGLLLAMRAFGIGVLAGALTAAMTYINQTRYDYETRIAAKQRMAVALETGEKIPGPKCPNLGKWLQVVTILIGTSSLACFAWGGTIVIITIKEALP